MAIDDLFDDRPDGMALSVHLVPGAGADAVAGTHGDALKVRVRAKPVAGKANESLVKFLAAALDVRRDEISLISGLGSRSKRVLVKLPREVLRERVAALVDASPQRRRSD